MGYFSRTKKSCISVFYIRTKFQSSPYNNKHFRILGGTVPLNSLTYHTCHNLSNYLIVCDSFCSNIYVYIELKMMLNLAVPAADIKHGGEAGCLNE